MELKSISSTPTFKKVRPGIIVGLVTGMLFGSPGALIMRFITWGVRVFFSCVSTNLCQWDFRRVDTWTARGLAWCFYCC